MAHLDLSPMITALSRSPADSDLHCGRLRHIPNGHRVEFDSQGGTARIETRCDCASLRISLDQSRELEGAFLGWKESYWRVVRINRDFASHFDRRLWPRLSTYLERCIQAGLTALGRLASFRRSRSDPQAVAGQIPAE